MEIPTLDYENAPTMKIPPLDYETATPRLSTSWREAS
jgi:hypothetical protein